MTLPTKQESKKQKKSEVYSLKESNELFWEKWGSLRGCWRPQTSLWHVGASSCARTPAASLHGRPVILSLHPLPFPEDGAESATL